MTSTEPPLPPIPDGLPTDPSPALLSHNPSSVYERRIVRQPHISDAALAVGFQETANRVAGAFTGTPYDDITFLPYLTLWRQAYELELKVLIRKLAASRRKHVQPNNKKLLPEVTNERIRRKHGHRMEPLLDEVLDHWTTLGLPTFPPDVEEIVRDFHDADEYGTAFRYSGDDLPNSVDYVDFPDLHKLLGDRFNLLSAAGDVAEEDERERSEQGS